MTGIIEKIKNTDAEVPAWDVALSSLAQEESEKLARGLRIADFQRLAAQHAIRFDDIMATMFELVLHSEWHYQHPDDVECPISRDEVEKLYVGGRLVEADVIEYVGLWLPK